MTEPSSLTREQVEALEHGWREELTKVFPSLAVMSFVGSKATAEWIQQRLAEAERDLVMAHDVQNGLMRDVQALSASLAEAMKEREALREERDEMRYRLQTWIDAHADNPALSPAPPAADTGERP